MDSLRTFTKGRTATELLEDPEVQKLLDERDLYKLKVKEYNEDGSAKVQCPARESGATVMCPIANQWMAKAKPQVGGETGI